MAVKLTKSVVEGVPIPGERESLTWDALIPGFGVAVSPKGKRTYFMFYRLPGGQQRRKRIGKHGAITTDEARNIAKDWSATIAKGQDPKAEPKAPPEVWTVKRLGTEYLAVHCKDEKSDAQTERDRDMLDGVIYPKWGKCRLDEVAKLSVRKWHRAMDKTPYRANRLLALLRTMYNFADANDLYLGRNPCKGVKPFKERVRHFRWTPAQKRSLGELLDDYRIRRERGDHYDTEHGGSLPSIHAVNAVWFMIHTGVRRSEALNLQWSQIKFNQGVIRWTKHKTARFHDKPMERPITKQLRDLLLEQQTKYRIEGVDWVFLNDKQDGPLVEIKRMWNTIRTRLKLKDEDGVPARIHDLRHLYADTCVDAGLTGRKSANLMHQSEATNEDYGQGSDDVRAADAQRVADQLERSGLVRKAA